MKIFSSAVAPTQAQTDKERLENMAARIAEREAEIKTFRDKEPALALADAFTAYGRHLDAPDNPKRKARTDPVMIPPVRPFRAFLLAVPKAERTGPLCPKLAEGYRSDAANTAKKIQRDFAECGIETHAGKGKAGRERVAVGFHSLRHTFVTMSAKSGVPLAKSKTQRILAA